MRPSTRQLGLSRHRSVTNGGFTILSAVDINGNEKQTDVKRAKTSGITAVRLSETQSNSPSLKEACEWAYNESVKLVWLSELAGLEKAKEKNATSKKTLVEMINELGSNEKSALLLIEHGNEYWPGGVEFGQIWEEGLIITGKVYAAAYVQTAKELVTAGITIPLGMQVQTSHEVSVTNAKTKETKKFSLETWMKELAEYKPTELKEALIGTGTEANPNNRLVSHPYGNKMTLAMEKPNSLYSYTDIEGHEFGSPRWMLQQALIREKLGITIPLAITEYGAATVTATAAGKASECQAFWSFMRTVQKGEVLTAPTTVAGYVPIIVVAVWYALYNKEPAGTESFGILQYSGGKGTETPVEEEGVFKKFKEGVEAL
jgi:hypothetical protein